MAFDGKKERLEAIFQGFENLLVAFSGGVDSAVVLAQAHKTPGLTALAVTARSASVPEREIEAAKNFARWLGVEHVILDTCEMDSADYKSNPVNRCYFCKSELYSRLWALARERGFEHIACGTNADDTGDHRPGIAAAEEARVWSPLRDAGLRKEDVRRLARELGLPVADKPAAACLASRVPYGEPITPEKLAMIEAAEDFLLSLGFAQLRVRHHGDIARIELLPEDVPRFFAGEFAAAADRRLREIGFKYIAVDIAGYRSGSLNPPLDARREGAAGAR